MTPAELQATIQQDNSKRSDLIDTISASMMERHRRCTSIPPETCTEEDREECDYYRMIELRATRGGLTMPRAELYAARDHGV